MPGVETAAHELDRGNGGKVERRGRRRVGRGVDRQQLAGDQQGAAPGEREPGRRADAGRRASRTAAWVAGEAFGTAMLACAEPGRAPGAGRLRQPSGRLQQPDGGGGEDRQVQRQ